MSKDKVSRRDFLRGTLAAGAGLAGATVFGCKPASSEDAAAAPTKLAQAPAAPAPMSSAQRSRVIHLNSANAFNLQTGQADSQTVNAMIQTGICHVTGEINPVQAWGRLVGPEDRVGIKVNCLGQPGFVNNAALLRVLKEHLMAAGVEAQNIVIFDRYNSHLTGGGFSIGQQADGTWVMATQGSGGPGYDQAVTQSFNPAKGGAAESAPCSKIVTQQITKMINVPILKNHGGSGVTLALKNIAFGIFQHTGSAHQANGNPYIPAMCSSPVIREKTVLTVLDGLKGQYDGGPQGKHQFQWAQGSILMSTDPVAVDFLGARLINQARQEHGKGLISDGHIKHIFTAAQMGIGHASEAEIEEVLVPV